MPTKIGWTGETWNPIIGCRATSPGCKNCYAARQAYRIPLLMRGRNPNATSVYDGLAKMTKGRVRWTGQFRYIPERLVETLRWQVGKRIFLGSMTDVCHPLVPHHWRLPIWAVMALTPRHTYQVLTKHPEDMVRFYEWLTKGRQSDCLNRIINEAARIHDTWPGRRPAWLTQAVEDIDTWPLPNVEIGVTAEDQNTYDYRARHLIQVPAAVRFFSLEPLLGPINLRLFDALTDFDCYSLHERIHGVIVGGETGAGARPCEVSWVRHIVGQCDEAELNAYVKQLGRVVIDRNDAGFMGESETDWPDDTRHHDWTPFRAHYQGAPVRIVLHNKAGADPEEWPRDLRRQDVPARRAA